MPPILISFVSALTWFYIGRYTLDSVRAHAHLPWRHALVVPKRFRDCYAAVCGAGAARWFWSQLLLAATPGASRSGLIGGLGG